MCITKTKTILKPPAFRGKGGRKSGGTEDNKMIINPRRACAARVTVLGCVCLSVWSHLTYGASVRPENPATYSAGNEG